ncbi:hypothetical protein [Litchfieldia salsa]|uniref:Lipoprotein n=1 Tax=Litchfieldia salsa TaxID=930152 RepID=A0A1H0RM69_9BACI|nr:hypothetical protein [Litchfieldia salsa]SDP30419.1 hypothetical protein SAMN05216565_102281 [Litchfieldia salsa]
MNRFLYVFLCLVILSACGLSRNESSPSDIDLNEGMSDTAEDGNQSDEELLVESRSARININHQNGYSRLESEKLVRNYLNINDKSNAIVLFDREENDNYILKVVETTNDNEKSTPYKWYSVNPQTGEVKPYK